MPTLLPRLATAAVAAGLTLGVAAPAVAQEATTDDGRGERCLEQIDRRLNDLATAQVRAAGVDALTDTHLATINSIIDTSEAGLADLAGQIEGTDDRETLIQLCTSVATDFRVYLVVLPQTHLAAGADRIDAAVARGGELIATFDDAVQAAIDAGADVGEAVALRDAAAAHLADAEANASGVGDQVLAVTPAAWNDGPGQVEIESSRAAVRAGHSDIRAGVEDARDALAALRAAIDAVT